MPRFQPLPFTVIACLLVALPMTAACSRADEAARTGNAQNHASAPAANATVASGGSLSSPLRDFARVDVTGPDDVEIAVGPDFSIRADGPDAVLDTLEFRQEGGALKVSRKRGAPKVDGSAHIRVTMPRLTGASLTGSGDLSIDSISGDDAMLALTGSGDVAVRALAVRALNVSMTGSGDMDLAGSAESAKFSLTGSGDINGERLKAGRADVSVLGSGNIDFASDGDVKASIMGSGDVAVAGNARCTKSGMGSGTLRCG